MTETNRKYRGTGMPMIEADWIRDLFERQRLDLKNPACADKDPSIFYQPRPPHRTNYAAELERNAEALFTCETCPDRVACLQWALENSEEHGIWGGCLAGERQGMESQSADWLIAHVERKREEAL